MAEEYEEIRLDLPEETVNKTTETDDSKVHVTDEIVHLLGHDSDEETERARKIHIKDTEARRDNALGLSRTARIFMSIGLMLFVLADIAAMGKMAASGMFTLAGKIIYIFHLDSLTYLNHSLLWVQTITTFILCFFIEGFLFDLLFYLSSTLSDRLNLYVRKKHFLIALFLAFIVALIFTVLEFSLGGSFEMYDTFKSAAPCAAYLGGILIYGLSVLRFEIE